MTKRLTAATLMRATAQLLPGIDYKRLTVRHNAIDSMLTDVHGRAISEILA